MIKQLNALLLQYNKISLFNTSRIDANVIFT